MFTFNILNPHSHSFMLKNNASKHSQGYGAALERHSEHHRIKLKIPITFTYLCQNPYSVDKNFKFWNLQTGSQEVAHFRCSFGLRLVCYYRTILENLI